MGSIEGGLWGHTELDMTEAAAAAAAASILEGFLMVFENAEAEAGVQKNKIGTWKGVCS